MRCLVIFFIVNICLVACHKSSVTGNGEVSTASIPTETIEHKISQNEEMLKKFDKGFYCDTVHFSIDSVKKRNILLRSIEELLTVRNKWLDGQRPDDLSEEDSIRIAEKDRSYLINTLSAAKRLNMKLLRGTVVIKKVDTFTCVMFEDKGHALDIFANHIYVDNVRKPTLKRYDSIVDLSWEDEVYYNWDKNEIAKLMKEEREWEDWNRLTSGMRIVLLNDTSATIEFYDENLVEKQYKIQE